jgi:N-acetylmuramoyl-L-alanine amidase
MPVNCVAAPSPNFDSRAKDKPIDILVMHYTGMQSGAAAIQRLTDEASRVSSHYTVDEDGTIYSHVPEDCRAWHAGKSYWAGATDINARSIGIEIVNPGHEFGYRSFPDAQIAAVIELSLDIFSRHAIPPERVLAHSDIAPARKQDPGELFPWEMLAKAGIGVWPELPPTPVRQSRADARPGAFGAPVESRAKHAGANRPSPHGGGESEPSLHLPPVGRSTREARRVGGEFEHMLRRYGYGVRPDADVSLEDVITAFQRHFRPANLNGIADAECEAILRALVGTLDKT